MPKNKVKHGPFCPCSGCKRIRAAIKGKVDAGIVYLIGDKRAVDKIKREG